MAGTPGDVPVTPGEGMNVATNKIAEAVSSDPATTGSQVVKQLQRINLADTTGADLAGSQTDAAADNTDDTPLTWTQIFKQISKSVQATAAALAGTLTVGGNVTTNDGGAAGTGIAQPTGGSGVSGWLSGIFKALTGTLDVNVINGASGGTSLADGSTFTEGTTAVTPAGGEYNPTPTNLAAGKFGAFRVLINRILMVALQDGSGNAISSTGGSINANITNLNGLGRKSSADSSSICQSSRGYNTVAASQTEVALSGGTGGAIGDYLDGFLIVPSSTSPGAVTVQDGNGTSITIFAGGANSLGNLVPFPADFGAVSVNGPWKVTTGAGVSLIAFGDFS